MLGVVMVSHGEEFGEGPPFGASPLYVATIFVPGHHWHISSQPAPSVPLVLGQRVLLVSPTSRTYFGHLRSIVKLEKSSLVVSVSPEPSAYGPFLPDTCHVHLPLLFVSLPWMCRIQYSIRFPTFR